MYRQAPLVSRARPLVGHVVEFVRTPIEVLARGHAEHGRAFTVQLGNERATVLVGPEHSRFYFSQTGTKLTQRNAYPFLPLMFDDDFFFLADVEEYQRQKALVLPRFQGGALSEYVGIMLEEVALLEEQLGDAGEIDLTSAFGPMVMRIGVHALVGRDFARSFGTDEFRVFRRFNNLANGILPAWIPTPDRIRGRRARAELHKILPAFLRQRRECPADPPDFLQCLAEARYENDSPVPDRTLVHLLNLFAWASHETTTGHMSWGLIDLLRHPDQLSRVREEADAVGDLTLEGVNRLRHLDNALRETERLHPVVFLMMRRALEDLAVDGYQIPAGSLVITSPWITHRLPDVFSEPEAYNPDRFADSKLKVNLFGFGAGAHKCLGTHFAYLEMKVVLSTLVRHYDLELADPDPMPVRGPKTKWPASPCLLRYRRRAGGPWGPVDSSAGRR